MILSEQFLYKRSCSFEILRKYFLSTKPSSEKCSHKFLPSSKIKIMKQKKQNKKTKQKTNKQKVTERIDHHVILNNFSLLCILRCDTDSYFINIGAVAIFLAWIDLLLFIQKFPSLGIYVVMFTHVTQSFLKFSITFLLFTMAFGLSFFFLFSDKVNEDI